MPKDTNKQPEIKKTALSTEEAPAEIVKYAVAPEEVESQIKLGSTQS